MRSAKQLFALLLALVMVLSACKQVPETTQPGTTVPTTQAPTTPGHSRRPAPGWHPLTTGRRHQARVHGTRHNNDTQPDVSPAPAPHKHKTKRGQPMHIAAHPAYPTIRRVTTQGRLSAADINELANLGYDITAALVTLTNTNRETIRDQAARGELTEHDLLDALTIDALRNPRT